MHMEQTRLFYYYTKKEKVIVQPRVRPKGKPIDIIYISVRRKDMAIRERSKTIEFDRVNFKFEMNIIKRTTQSTENCTINYKVQKKKKIKTL